jgi:hypothetical protein
MRPHTLIFIAALLTAQVGAQQPSPVIGATYSRPSAGALVLLLPPIAETVELEPGIPILLKALHVELSSAGYRTALLDKKNFEVLWSQEVEAVGGVFDTRTGAPKLRERAAAVAALAVRLAKETSAAVVIYPGLITRTAEIHSTKAEWDGRLESIPTRGTFGGNSHHSGNTPAISVQLTTVSASGNIAFMTFGGVALPYVVNFVSEKPELRKDLFESEKDVYAGVRIALSPLTKK